MKFYVTTQNLNQVTLMTELGHVLGYFESVTEALNTCNEWYLMNLNEPKYQVNIASNAQELLSEGSII